MVEFLCNFVTNVFFFNDFTPSGFFTLALSGNFFTGV